MLDGYDTAEICPNGHVSTEMAASYPQHRQPFCERCGEPTITTCPKCQAQIRGHYHAPGVVGFYDYKPPNFCYRCGSAFPWTERKQQAAIELFIEETQDQKHRQEFRESVEQIIKDTPQAQVASKRINRLLGTIAKGTASLIRDILVDIASEAARKLLMPGD